MIKKLQTGIMSLLFVSCGASVVDIHSYMAGLDSSVNSNDSSLVEEPTIKLNFESEDGLSGSGNGVTINGSNQLVVDNTNSANFEFESPGLLTSLLAHWKFEGTVGTTVGDGNLISDGVGTNNGAAVDSNLTLTYVHGINSTGLDFDGTDDYLTIPSSPDLEVAGDQLTLMAWVYIDATSTSNPAIICKGAGIGSESYMLGINGLPQSFSFITTVSGVQTQLDAGQFVTGQWYHVAGVYSGSSIMLYVNGRFVANTPQSGNLDTSADNLNIGKKCGADNRFFDGKIDEVRVWDTGLSSEDVATIYFAEKQKFSFQSSVLDSLEPVFWKTFGWETEVPWGKELPDNGLVETGYTSGNADMTGNIMLYHFNEKGTPTTFTDSSGVGNDASCGNCPTVRDNGLFDSSLVFNGTNQYVEIPHQPEFLVDQGTINLWYFAQRKFNPTDQHIIGKDATGYGDGGHLLIYLLADDNNILLRLQSDSANYVINTVGGEVKYHQWQMLTFRFGPVGMELFIDGQSVGSNPYIGGLGTSSGGAGNTEPFAIGANTGTSTAGSIFPLIEYFRGEIDEVGMWNRELSYAEIQDLYRRGANKIKFQVRTCTQSDCSDDPNFVGPAGDSAAYFSELLNTTANTNSFDLSPIFTTKSQYFQYSLEVEPENFADPVVIDNVHIEASEN